MKRRNNILLVAWLGLLLPFAATVAEEKDASSIASAMTSGKASISGRYRYEHCLLYTSDAADDTQFV